MEGRGGVILNVASAAGLYPSSPQPIYSASKGLFSSFFSSTWNPKCVAQLNNCPRNGFCSPFLLFFSMVILVATITYFVATVAFLVSQLIVANGFVTCCSGGGDVHKVTVEA